MDENNDTHNAISAYFIGPRAENLDNFRGNVTKILKQLKKARIRYADSNGDTDYITSGNKESEQYKRITDRFEKAVNNTANLLGKHSIPFWSPRYQAHMGTDLTMPSLLGYFMASIYNSNNVAIEFVFKSLSFCLTYANNGGGHPRSLL
ncbi:hypothetical protein DIS24_g11108 [Lasiodiplodia hormozganensis]|uniref:Uncharacterized protein n=1 Tax=Lasiodiplodia hormozganensis TaxID=869390 RepID=A0AA40C5A4_9PEZI|nr:hypothetical protein DIS24_g11108 [Lasiodiplodia hormozganensis]